MFAWLKDWAPVIAIGISFLALCAVPVARWLYRPRLVTHADLEKVTAQLSASEKLVADRISSIEQDVALIRNDIDHLPQRADFDRLSSNVNQVQIDVAALRAQGTATMATLGRISDHLLSQSK